jgi:tellurite resistance protein TehA-like permease
VPWLAKGQLGFGFALELIATLYHILKVVSSIETPISKMNPLWLLLLA